MIMTTYIVFIIVVYKIGPHTSRRLLLCLPSLPPFPTLVKRKDACWWTVDGPSLSP